jgi:elongation factor Ts
MSIDLIKSIREKTGLPLNSIKKAIEELDTQIESEIIDHLRKQGVLKQASRSDRVTSQGSIFAYVHEGRIGVMLEIRCETDFVARSQAFQTLGNDVALHIAAYRPQFVSPDNVDKDFVEKEIEIAKAQLAQEGKPENIIEKILEGKKSKILEENSLLTQPFLKDPKKTVGDQILEVGVATGEKIELTRFEIYSLT